MLGGQPRNLRPSPPCLASQTLCPCTPPKRALLLGARLNLGVFVQSSTRFSTGDCFPAKLRLLSFPSPGNQLLYYPVHPSAKQNPPRASHWAPVMTVPMLRTRSPRRPHQRSSQPDLSKHIWSSAGKPVYHFPSGSFILFKGEEKRQGLRNVCSIFHS